MKKLLYRVLCFLQIHRLLRFLLRKKTIILTYHGITDQVNHPGIENYDAKHLHVSRLERQMRVLKQHYHVLSLDQWLEHRSTRKKLPRNAVVITFDDGYRSNYTLAYPILKKLNLPATFFLTTDFVESRKYLWVDRVEYALNHSRADHLELGLGEQKSHISLGLPETEDRILCAARIKSQIKNVPQDVQASLVEELEHSLGESLAQAREIPSIYEPLEWREIREMTESGLLSVGSHTHHHRILSRCRSEEARQELLISKQLVEATLGKACRLFCYPNGEEGDFNAETKQLLEETGYACGLTSVDGFNDENSDVFELKRLGVSNHANEMEFVMTLAGVKKWISDFKRAVWKCFGKKPVPPLHGTAQGADRPAAPPPDRTRPRGDGTATALSPTAKER